MIIFIHKVRMNPMDGWGRSTGMCIEILGYYKDKETAIEAKKERDSSVNYRHCDVGESWIEEILVK